MDVNFLHPGPNKEITVLWSGATFSLQVPTDARIIQVKQLISDVLYIPIRADRQALSWKGQFLADELSLQDYQIPHNATILVLNKIQVRIHIEPDGFYLEFAVYDGLSVGDLKAKIHRENGINVEDKVMRFGNIDLDDRAHLWAAGIGEGSVLHLVC